MGKNLFKLPIKTPEQRPRACSAYLTDSQEQQPKPENSMKAL